MTRKTDAVARLLNQFKGSNLEDLIEVIFDKINEVETAIEWLRDNVNINDAPGFWLDLIGDIVGIPRPPLQHPYGQMFAFKDGSTVDDFVDDPYKAFLKYTETLGSELVLNGGFPTNLDNWIDRSAAPGQATWDTNAAKVASDSGSAELIVNGTFGSDVSGWSAIGAGTVTWSSSYGGSMKLDFPANGGGTERAEQTITTVAGYTYQIGIETKQAASNNLQFVIGTTSGGGQYLQENINSATTYTYNFVATGTTCYVDVDLISASIGDVAYVDNITCQLVSPQSVGILDQAVTVTPNLTYEFSIEILTGSTTSGTWQADVRVGTALGAKNLYWYPVAAIGTQTARIKIPSGVAQAYIRVRCSEPGDFVHFDNVSLKQVTFGVGTIGGYLQHPKGLAHLTTDADMSDADYRPQVKAKALANGRDGTIPDIYEFMADGFGTNDPTIADEIGHADVTIAARDVLSQNDRYRANFYGPHSAGVTIDVLNWTYEHWPWTHTTPANWTIQGTSIDGDTSKELLCDTADIAYLHRDYFGITASQAAYGSWQLWLFAAASTNPYWLFVASTNVTYSNALQNGYVLYYTSSGQLVLSRISAGSLTTLRATATSYVSAGWHKLEVTRSAAGLFSVEFDDASPFTNVTDTTHTVGTYQTVELDAGNRIGLVTLEDVGLATYSTT